MMFKSNNNKKKSKNNDGDSISNINDDNKSITK